MIIGEKKSNRKEAVSPVVGEMLVLTMVLILAAVFSSSLSGFIPEDRPESVDLAIYGYSYNDVTGTGNVTFWHKGGDPIALSGIRVVFSSSTKTEIVKFEINSSGNSNMPVSGSKKDYVLLPGDYMDIDPGINVSGWDVRIATSDAVIFMGKVYEGE